MALTDQETALIGVFPDSQEATRYVEELRRAGFRNEDVGVVTPNAGGSTSGETYAEEGAAAGAVTGGTLGTLAGLAVATGLLPPIGPVFAAGLLAGILASTATGAAAGGLIGALIGMGIPEEEARRYEGELKAGRTLVVVQEKLRLPEALAILRRCRHEDDKVTR